MLLMEIAAGFAVLPPRSQYPRTGRLPHHAHLVPYSWSDTIHHEKYWIPKNNIINLPAGDFVSPHRRLGAGSDHRRPAASDCNQVTRCMQHSLNHYYLWQSSTSPYQMDTDSMWPNNSLPGTMLKTVILPAIFIVSLNLGTIFAQDSRPSAAGPKRDEAQKSATNEPPEEVFSGPQRGEQLSALPLHLALGPKAGTEFDPVTVAADKPVLLIFVHDINRQSIGMTRVLSGYAATRKDAGLQSAVIFLSDDLPAAEAQIGRMQHALTPDVPTGVSVDGREGPGNWGLNRNVTLTIVHGKAGRVTGNFALIQPSLQADLPKILKSLVTEIGGEVPSLDTLPGMPAMAARGPANSAAAPDMRALLGPVIRRDATPEDVQQAAAKVEASAAADPAVRAELARISTTIVKSGKLTNYGTMKAQEYLTKWAKQYGDPNSEKEKTPRE